MTKLTKEECELSLKVAFTDEDEFDYYGENRAHQVDMAMERLEQLIEEHFELLKKYDDVCDKFHDDHFELENLKRDYKLLGWELKHKEKALDKACEILSSRGIPYEEKIENGFITYANYFNSKEWKNYLMNELKENGKELGE